MNSSPPAGITARRQSDLEAWLPAGSAEEKGEKADLSWGSSSGVRTDLGDLWTHLLEEIASILAGRDQNIGTLWRDQLVTGDKTTAFEYESSDHRSLSPTRSFPVATRSEHYQTRHTVEESDSGAYFCRLGRRPTRIYGD